MNKLLVAGASENTVTDENRTYHYTSLLRNCYNVNISNISVGGLSNDEIFYRSVTAINDDHFDCVFIMWAPLDRKWVHISDNNVDDATILNPDCRRWDKKKNELKQYSKLHWTCFNNQYVLLRNWLVQIISLQSMLKIKNIPYIMVHDVDNYITDLDKATYSTDVGFIVSQHLETILDITNRPDDYVIMKLNQLKELLKNIDTSNWIGFFDYRFFEQKIDYSMDRLHAGPKSHQKFFELMTEELKTRKLLN